MYPRTAKTIALSPAARAMLEIEEEKPELWPQIVARTQASNGLEDLLYLSNIRVM